MGTVLHSEDPYIREHLFDGLVGLEMESLRVDHFGNISRKPHPFPCDPVIDRDFGEAQIEIGILPKESVRDAVKELKRALKTVHVRLAENGELLWPFSNPPIIRDEEDIVIARYEGERRQKTLYRQYLAGKYGKYKMTLSGIHFNYSFSKKLLERNLMLDHGGELKEYSDHFYLELAQKVLKYGWMIVALLGASPLVDISFYLKGAFGKTIFTGKSSLRCSESGYWNYFVPGIDYSNLKAYAASIGKYVQSGMLAKETELYYPVRVKNPGAYSLEGLTENGINHIELRMVDLNPYSNHGIEYLDTAFVKLFLIWLASKDTEPLRTAEQVQALQNLKDAAGFDWEVTRLSFPGGRPQSLREALSECLAEMSEFFGSSSSNILEYQMEKVRNAEKRYAYRVAADYGDDYIVRGLKRAKEIQEAMYVRNSWNHLKKAVCCK